jgi:pSer/pThr/pTyr-binding forkhead associated (FHA) protein
MDWYTLLFAARWAIIALVYFVLVVLFVGVYREASQRLGEKPGNEAISYGRLRVIHPGSDSRLSTGSILNLNTVTNLGADQNNDIVLGDQFVSGHHIRLRWDGAVWWVEDLDSKNGTLVNRQPVKPGQHQALSRGSVITVGDMVMELID